MKKFAHYVGEKKLSEIRPVDIHQWIGELKKVMTEKSVSRKISEITNYFHWLEGENVLAANPAQNIRYLRVTLPLPDLLFENERQQLLTVASKDPRTYIKAPVGDMKVLETLPAYYLYLKDGGCSRYTPDDFTGDLKKFGLFLKEKPIKDIAGKDIRSWISFLKTPNSRSSWYQEDAA